ncbi:zinc metalloproteinase nas-34-like [Penaeus chinensis]|uniref:zinc metalloproteinase nas-34-like n=1 Tax=Penaeus chinensis TaxID=139456 RepID=UPI001FB60C3C|nr:zinc metalloproteinase nas-34-like [Penaeus chinensis]
MSPHWLAVGLLFAASLGQAERKTGKDATYLPAIDRNVENNGTEHPTLPGNHHGDEGDDILLTEEQLAAANLSRSSEELLEKLGDTMLTPEQLAAILDRKAITDVTRHWPDVNGFPHIPYTFEDDLVDKAAVRSAIQHWIDNTCLTFTEVPNTSTGERIKFIRHSSACNSYVGMVSGSGGQIINVPVWCEQSFGSLVHEVGHALGLWHEQSRSDRDAHLIILTQNIRAAALHNFNLWTTNNYGVPYDYTSIMHYGGQGFSLNAHNTIVTRDPRFQAAIGQREGLSHMDKLLVNTMYGCTDKLLITCGLASDPCQNNGYLINDCTCACPDGTSGSQCETVDTLYNDAILDISTEIVTVEKSVATVNYPNRFMFGSDFVKRIIAPECNEVKLTFTAFEVWGAVLRNIDGVSTLGCWYDALEIRTTNTTEGQWFCGTDISPGQVFQSVGGEIILYFKVGSSNMPGWSADITFVPIPSCTPSGADTTTTTSPSTTTSTSTSTTTTTSISTTTRMSTTTSTAPTTSTTPRMSTTTSTAPTTSTTTTTTSTSTTTTSTSTTTTSTSTTTTSTSTSTTTTATTTTTTTTASVGQCTSYTNNGLTNFLSPNFPDDYPPNAYCKLSGITEELATVDLLIKSLRLRAGDTLVIQNPYTPPLTLSGRRRRYKNSIPSAQFLATFTSNAAGEWMGFHAQFRPRTSSCHKVLSASPGGVIMSPRFPRKHPGRKYCEWKIMASVGKKVQLTFTHMRLGTSAQNYVAVNPTTDPYYAPGSVLSFNGFALPPGVTSDSNLMRIFFSGRRRSRGFRLMYSEF